MTRRFGELFARFRGNAWAGRLDAALLALHKGYENLDYNMHSNGELSVLRRLARTGSINTVFDVGANRGDWSDLVTSLYGSARIHAFEIVPETFAHLKARFENNGNMILNDVGLADTDETLTVYFSPERHWIATCVAGFSETFHLYRPEPLKVSATTGDRYCELREIDHIDLLKIDVEGLEPRVLKGFESMLRAGRINVVQFEYGYINIDTHFLLKDYYHYLSQFNMQIGKIYPNHVDFRPYRHVDENFYGPNYMAVRADRSDLLCALRGTP